MSDDQFKEARVNARAWGLCVCGTSLLLATNQDSLLTSKRPPPLARQRKLTNVTTAGSLSGSRSSRSDVTQFLEFEK